MSIAFTFTSSPDQDVDTIVVGVYKDEDLTGASAKLDKEHKGIVSQQISKESKFKGKAGQFINITTTEHKSLTRIIVAGLGETDKLDKETAEIIGGKLSLKLNEFGAEDVAIYLEPHKDTSALAAGNLAVHVAIGLKLRSYKFEKYKTKKDDDDLPIELNNVEFVTEKADQAESLFEELAASLEGAYLARDLVNEPPNTLYPESFAEIIKKELKPLGVDIEIIDDKKMHRLGFHAHLNVGMGSARPPCVVIMRWMGSGKKDTKPLAFVGKGVTFDTGGINLKPSTGMIDMKLDMGGAATVVGLMKTLALRKAKCDVIGIASLAENMPSERAYRPSDVIASMSGKTIEVMNTDAEGRLLLCDGLTYVQKTYKPELVIDLATLTGAMMVALGYEYCGTFVNDDELWNKLEQASKDSTEKLWRMPLDKAYKKETESKIADVKSLGNSSYGGACTAAGFLWNFIDDDMKWAHMDIAGTAWIKSDTPTCPKPGTGFGVRVLDRFIANNYE